MTQKAELSAAAHHPRFPKVTEGILQVIIFVRPCSKCNIMKARTPEFFHKYKKRPDGLEYECKTCASQRKKDARKANPDVVRSKDRAKYNNRIDHYRALGRKTTSKYRDNNHDKVLEATRKWKRENREHISGYNKWYRNINPEKNGESLQKRRDRLMGLPRDFTAEDWQYALEYFDYSCAICGKHHSDNSLITPDHWIPLASSELENPGTVPENILPLCFGIAGCQGSKHANNPYDWMTSRFSEEVGADIVKRIHAYFSTVRKTTGTTI